MKYLIFLSVLFLLKNSGFCDSRDNIEKNNETLAKMYGVEKVICSDLSVRQCLQAQQQAMETAKTFPRNYSATVIKEIALSYHNSNSLIPSHGSIKINPTGIINFIAFMDSTVTEESIKMIADIKETNKILARLYGVEKVFCSDLSIKQCFQAQQQAMELIETSPRDYNGTVIKEMALSYYDHDNFISCCGLIIVNAREEEEDFTIFMDQQI